MLAWHLPRALLVGLPAQVVRVNSARRGTDQPRPALGESGRRCPLESTEPGAAGVHVDVDDVHSRDRTGRYSDVGIGPTLPPVPHCRDLRACAAKTVARERLLPAWRAWEDRDV